LAKITLNPTYIKQGWGRPQGSNSRPSLLFYYKLWIFAKEEPWQNTKRSQFPILLFFYLYYQTPTLCLPAVQIFG